MRVNLGSLKKLEVKYVKRKKIVLSYARIFYNNIQIKLILRVKPEMGVSKEAYHFSVSPLYN